MTRMAVITESFAPDFELCAPLNRRCQARFHLDTREHKCRRH